MRTLVLSLPLLVACAEGPSSETLLTELRVVSLVAEPAEAMPAEPTAFDLTVADPVGTGADVVLWACTPSGRGCLEDGDPLASRLVTGALDGHRFEARMAPSAALAGLLPDEGTVAGAVWWALACEPGLCPLVEDARAALATGAPTPAALAADLADPTPWLADLPLEGVTLATRTLPVSWRPEGVRNENPRVTVENGGDLVIAPGERLDLVVTVEDEEPLVPAAFGYATGGGFGMAAFDLPGGEGALAWYAPTEEGPVDLFVVVDDQDGGAAVWTGSAVVGE